MARLVPLFLLLAFCASAQELPNADLLEQPPRVATAATCPKVDDWSTPSEKSCYRTTPRYDETMAYISRIAKAASRQVRVQSFGKTGQGRDLLAVIVSKDDVFDPVAIHKANRPVIYIQNSIHAGEMDGKDASLALLRDMLIPCRPSREHLWAKVLDAEARCGPATRRACRGFVNICSLRKMIEEQKAVSRSRSQEKSPVAFLRLSTKSLVKLRELHEFLPDRVFGKASLGYRTDFFPTNFPTKLRDLGPFALLCSNWQQ